MPYFVYIFQSKSTGGFYVGQTDDLELRLIKHNSGFVPSTKSARPWTRVWSEAHPTQSSAMCRERQIKQWKGRKMIQRLIDTSTAF